MIRLMLLTSCVLVSLLSVGCCGPMGCGIGCGTHDCYDCDGTAGRTIPYGPLDRLRQAKRNLICGGGGCGETYVGEWISTPPDANDPCCGDQFVGGATPCRPFCHQPGSIWAALNIYGKRHCSGNESSAPCSCGGCDDGGCGCESGEYVTTSEVIPAASSAPSSCGCATCKRPSNSNTTRIARKIPAPPQMNRSSSSNRIRR